jgi:DNA invertase Pin-like site-specific DNA recombinase
VNELGPGTRVAIYIRVSRDDQDPTLQHHEIDAFVASRGWEVFKKYVDQGQSGARDRRPALVELMTDARRLQFRAVVVWKLDRFGRDVRHLLNTLHELENQLGIRFVSVKEAFDTSSPFGELIRGFFALIAQWERRQNAERTSAGMKARQRSGVRLGRPKRLTPEQLELALQLHGRGHSIRQIAAEVDATRSSVQRALERARQATRRE